MQYFECKCGQRKAWTSGERPTPCDPCTNCGTVPGRPPAEPIPHLFVINQVETDLGPQPLSRCQWCFRTKREIAEREADGEIEEDFPLKDLITGD